MRGRSKRFGAELDGIGCSSWEMNSLEPSAVSGASSVTECDEFAFRGDPGRDLSSKG